MVTEPLSPAVTLSREGTEKTTIQSRGQFFNLGQHLFCHFRATAICKNSWNISVLCAVNSCVPSREPNWVGNEFHFKDPVFVADRGARPLRSHFLQNPGKNSPACQLYFCALALLWSLSNSKSRLVLLIWAMTLCYPIPEAAETQLN